jgi:hypothetical protein
MAFLHESCDGRELADRERRGDRAPDDEAQDGRVATDILGVRRPRSKAGWIRALPAGLYRQ